MRQTRAHIDLDALDHNLHVVRSRTHKAEVLAMVKANAYGHGLIPISRHLLSRGVEHLGVAFVDEARDLRQAGVTGSIIVMIPPHLHEVNDVVDLDLTTVVGDVAEASALSEAARAKGQRARIHVYVDTGMRRDGIRPEHILDVLHEIDNLHGLDVEGLCTHFATSDEPHSPFLQEQLSSFLSVVESTRAQGRTFRHIHAANTGAIWQNVAQDFTLVRPGMSLYGYASPGADAQPLRPVLSITSQVLSLRTVWPGESVSYGRRWISPTQTTIATIPIGYGDGYARGLSGKAFVLIGGERYPVVGTICMDECMVDVGNAPVAVGDTVVILGMQPRPDGHLQSIDATDIAEWGSTIPYEVTTAFSARIPRLYSGSSSTSQEVGNV
ncbi:MAG TPA: alanine racemase [Chlorobiota bacterium]|nr:alanine racemase [Chlorobiota bacterium]